MPIDRAAALRNADKLVRQGKADAAIAEYLRIVDDQPRDWNTANILGDLYVRAGQAERAIDQFVRIADALSDEGFIQKAGALYKKVIKLQPDHEHALLQAAQLAATQGLLADARLYLNVVLGQRRGRGDVAGVADARVRLGSLDPNDFSARFAGANARVELNDTPGAVRELKKIASELADKGRPTDAIEVLLEAAALDPTDEEIRGCMLEAYLATGDLARAREIARTADQCRRLAERQLLSDNPEAGLALLRDLLADDADQWDAIALIGCTIAVERPDVAFRVVELATDAAMTGAHWPAAAAALQEFVTRVPNHIPALLRLVEVCVDGGLDIAVLSAQAQLADAYLAAGAAVEARFIAEDLVTREPREKANVERFRRALELIGEPDPDAVIAEHLSEQSSDAEWTLEVPRPDPEVEPPPISRMMPEASSGRDHFALGANTLDLAGFLAEIETPPGGVHLPTDSVEVDLSIVLDDISRQPAGAPNAAPAAESGRSVGDAASASLDGVFESLRGQAAQRSEADAAEDLYERALALQGAGDIDGCVQALQEASRAPGLRFRAASLAGRLLRREGRMSQAIEWLERAAQAPAPAPEEAHELLYELAESLEASGESARALAVSLELQADAGQYRDIARRIDRLTKVQARG